MRHILRITTALACLLSFAAAASANNATVENALKSRPDLSSFYAQLQNTGVLAELKEGQPYTVFAPTNDAFARIDSARYPCFYAPACQAEAAMVMRKHIVPGEKHLSKTNSDGGIESLFSIDNQHIVAAQPNKDKYTVDSRNVISEQQLLGGVLYKIDGVLVTDKDLVQFEAPKVVVIHEAGSDLPPRVPPGKVITVTTTDATTPIPH